MRVSIQQTEPGTMVESASAARDSWQVIERLAELELGGAANAVRHRERGASGSAIVEALAALDHAQQPLPADDGLVQANENWLAAAATSERRLQAMSHSASVGTSRLTSKYIGETEKNLNAAFEPAPPLRAELLLDDSDALFDRSSDTKDSDD